MGANAQTAVPAFTAGQVLTAAQMTQVNTGVPVFASSTERDAAFGGAGEKTLAEGQFAFLEDSDTVQFYDGSAWQTVGASSVKKVERFTASGTWTVPTGVTFAIAHIVGGGGGVGASTGNAGQGGSSSVAFSGGTITATGGNPMAASGDGGNITGGQVWAGQANSGHGAGAASGKTGASASGRAEDGMYVMAGDTVTPAASISVTVGAGGAAATGGDGGAAGGSGYVVIEYQEPA